MPQDGERGVAKDGTRVVWRAELGRAVPIDPAGMERLDGEYRRNQIGQTYRQGPQGGLSRVAGPTDKMADDAVTQAQGLNTALAGIDRVDRQLKQTKNIGPMGWITNPTDISTLAQSVKDLQLRLKEQPYNLGVLNGPDLDLLEAIVANPEQLKSAAFRQTIAPRLANLSAIIGEQYRANEGSFSSLGGRGEALPPLYRSPRSKYSPTEFGHSGKIDPTAQGTLKNPFAAELARDRDTLPRGSYYVDPQGNIRRNENGSSGNPIIQKGQAPKAGPSKPVKQQSNDELLRTLGLK